MRGASILTLFALAGCASTAPRASADLDGQVRQLRAEQERQARQIEILENRVVLAEDSARAARAATGASSTRTVRIGGESHASGDEAVPSNAEPIRSANVDANDDDDDAPAAADNTPRPVIRATGRDNTPAPANPITVREEDRLPVAPVPPAPPINGPANGRGPRDDSPGSSLPAAVAPPLAHVAPLPSTMSPGVSSVRDPRAAPAYDSALAFARGGQCTEAVAAFSDFLVRWPDHPFADNAMYWRGECILRNGDVRRAANEFEGLIARFPVGNKVPDALFKLVQCYDRLGDSTRARSFAARLLREFPQSEVAARLRAERNGR